MNATEADGYVVYITQLPQSTNTTAVDVGNVTQYTLGGLVPGNTYNITVRAYQDLLGPESDGIQPTISAGMKIIQCNYFALRKAILILQWCFSLSVGHCCPIVLVQWPSIVCTVLLHMLFLSTLYGERMALL